MTDKFNSLINILDVGDIKFFLLVIKKNLKNKKEFIMSQMKATVDKLLTQASAGYFPKGFACEKILPEVRVKQWSGKLAKYGTNHLRIETNYSGGRGEYRRAEPIVREQATYQIEGHGLETLVSASELANVDSPYQALTDSVLGLTSQLILENFISNF